MRQFQKQFPEPEEDFEKRQMQSWLAESHYWVEENQTFYCKWCGKLTTTNLEFDAYLCRENPEIKKLLTNLPHSQAEEMVEKIRGEGFQIWDTDIVVRLDDIIKILKGK